MFIYCAAKYIFLETSTVQIKRK